MRTVPSTFTPSSHVQSSSVSRSMLAELLHADVGAQEIATAELLVDAGRRVADSTPGRRRRPASPRRRRRAPSSSDAVVAARALVDVERGDGHARLGALSGDRRAEARAAPVTTATGPPTRLRSADPSVLSGRRHPALIRPARRRV